MTRRVGRWVSNQDSTGSNSRPEVESNATAWFQVEIGARLRNDHGQIVHTFMPVTKHYVRYRRKLGRRQVDHVMQQVRIRRLISWRLAKGTTETEISAVPYGLAMWCLYVNVTAFAPAAEAIDRYLLPARPTAGNPAHAAAANEWDRQTDTVRFIDPTPHSMPAVPKRNKKRHNNKTDSSAGMCSRRTTAWGSNIKIGSRQQGLSVQ